MHLSIYIRSYLPLRVSRLVQAKVESHSTFKVASYILIPICCGTTNQQLNTMYVLGFEALE